jgi:hypothetical protein
VGYKFLADQNQLVFKYESGTYAVASGTRHWIGMVQDHTPDEDAGVVNIRYQGSTNRNIDAFTNGPLNNTGTFTYYPQDWKFLGFAIGSVSETAAAGSHVITETNSDDSNYAIPTQSLSSFTLEDSKKTPTAGSNFIRTFKGCMVDSYTVNLTEGEIVSCDVGYRAQSVDFSSGAVTAVTPTTTTPYLWSDVRVHLPSGTTLTNATEFSLTVNNNLEARFPLNGSRTIEEAIPLNRDYEISATFIMDASNAKPLYDQYFIGGSSFNSMVQIQATAGSAYIIMSGCRITDMEVPSPVEGLHEQTMTIMPTSLSVNVHDSLGSVYNAWKE